MILSLLVFLPVFFALVVASWPQKRTTRHLALGFAVIQFLLSLAMMQGFDSNTAALQMVEKTLWVERFGISYFLGIDGIFNDVLAGEHFCAANHHGRIGRRGAKRHRHGKCNKG